MKKTIAAVALAAGVVGLTACGPGYTTTANQSYCVDQQTGQVMAPQYCQVGGFYYHPGVYDYWVGPTYGHSYRPGTVIQHNYFVSGQKVNPSSTSARKAAGLPVSGSVSNGAKSSTTTKTTGGVPAKPQNSPSKTGVSGSTSKSSGTKSSTSYGSSTKSSTTTKSTSSFGGSSSRSSSSFGGSSSRSSSSFGSSGGRK